MSAYKTERNEAIYELRARNRSKYSYNRLAKVFGIHKITAKMVVIAEAKRRRVAFQKG